MSVAQLQEELSKLTAQEKLVLADYLARQAEESSELSTSQLAESALATDWNKSKEDTAWRHFQNDKRP